MTRPTSWSRHLILLCFILMMVTAGRVRSEDTTTAPPELPQPIWRALLGDTSVIMRADIEQLLGLPEVVFFLDDPSAAEMELFMFRDFVSILQAIPPIGDAGLDLWKIEGNTDFYVHTTLSREAIMSEYRNWGWIPVEDDDGSQYFRQPLDDDDETAILDYIEVRRGGWERQEEELAEFRAAAETGDPEAVRYLELWASPEQNEPFDLDAAAQEIRSELERGKWKMLPGDSGWLSLRSSWGHPSPFEMKQPADEELSEFRDFPLGSFLEEVPADLLFISMVLPDRYPVPVSQPEPGFREETDPHRARLEQELEELVNESRALSGRDEAEILENIGDMQLRVNEIDGGLDLDLVAEIPGNPDDSFTAEAIQMALGFLRMSAVSNSPELARELLDTTTSLSNNRLRARVNVSHASLMDTIRGALEKHRRSRKIWKRIEEIRSELADLEADGPS